MVKIQGPKPSASATTQAQPSKTKAEDSSRGAFERALGGATTSPTPRISPTEAASAVDKLIEALDAGEVHGVDFIDELIDRVVAKRGQGLDAPQRDDLRRLLRRTFLDDPRLQQAMRAFSGEA